jgi:glycosyltransferase involved in cell wall biosynthesis
VYFGFLTKAKDPETLLAAYKRLVQRGCGHRLVLVAEVLPGNRAHRRVLRKIGQLGLTDKITITGYCRPDQVSRYLRGADLCVLPFSDGASPRHATLITALQHGLATVTTFQDTVPAEFENWHNVVLTPVSNPEAMAEAMLTLLNDPLRRAAIASQAKVLGDRFAWSLIAQKHCHLYQQVQCTRSRRS